MQKLQEKRREDAAAHRLFLCIADPGLDMHIDSGFDILGSALCAAASVVLTFIVLGPARPVPN